MQELLALHIGFLKSAPAPKSLSQLPFRTTGKVFSLLKEESSQLKKQLIGMAIQQEVFFYTFVLSAENRINPLVFIKIFDQYIGEEPRFLITCIMV